MSDRQMCETAATGTGSRGPGRGGAGACERALPDLKTFMWYRTSFRVPRRHKRLTLLFMAAGGSHPVVYVNGKETSAPERIWSEKRSSYEVDITETVKPGRNLLAVRIQHSSRIPAGIVRPVLLIQKAEE